jgi:hypothetical protein
MTLASWWFNPLNYPTWFILLLFALAAAAAWVKWKQGDDDEGQ